MQPRLEKIIPAQNFELIRDRLAEILLCELQNQKLLGAIDLVPSVWMERITPFDETDIPAVNILLLQGDYSNKNQLSTVGEYSFAVDIYTAEKSTTNSDGDQLSAISIHRMLGMCRAILENPAYKTLGFVPPFNCTTLVKGFQFADFNIRSDANSTRMARLNFMAKVPEAVEIKDPIGHAFPSTRVKLCLTNKGYRYDAR